MIVIIYNATADDHHDDEDDNNINNTENELIWVKTEISRETPENTTY